LADVKWIKITTDVFDDEKILLIESLPEADSIIVIWFKLLCLAGKQNNSGVFMMGNQIAYTDKMLATIFRRKESTVQLALQTFEQFGMIELIDGVITIPNWGKHQNLDQIEKKRNSQRQYMREYRERQKMLSGKANGKTNSKANVSRIEEEREKEKNKNKKREERGKEEATDYFQIADLFNSLCPSLPPVQFVSDSMKTNLSESMDKFSLDDFTTLFKKVEKSSFLKGKNERKWSATFDWLIKVENIAKVLNGNYDNKKEESNSEYDYAEIFKKIVAKEWEEKEPPKTAADDENIRAKAEALKKELSGKK
jgi:predicted phage replisome organizer